MTLDPIVSLAVALAEGPGSYAFLLGSGVSRDAGVPTGQDVFWQAVGELYRVENVAEETPDREVLQNWLRDTEREGLTYSDVLELITPDAATRRDYLAKHFEDVEPGETHELLAELARAGSINVFITTNFDRLLERALQAKGIEPVVITSDADLRAAPSREHSRCYVLKPHGDYLQQTIRNTPEELAELEPGVTAQLQEVFDRYGLVVLGYAGADEAIAAALRARRSRYGVYWVSRAELAEPAQSLVEAVGGRVIERPGAAEFLRDLHRRLVVFAAHPSGMTPVAVHDQVLALLRGRDTVGLRELLRGEARAFEDAVTGPIRSRHQELPTDEIAMQCHDQLLPAIERRLATLAPLVLHDSETFAQQVDTLAEVKNRLPVLGGYTFWPELLNWALWWLSYALGGLAVREQRLAALKPLFSTTTTARYSGTEPLVQSLPGGAGHSIGTLVMREIEDRNWIAPAFEALRAELAASSVMQERYPELVSTDGEPLRSLISFDFLVSAALGLQDHRAAAHWTMYGESAQGFARQLHADPRLREQVADTMGHSLDEFDERAPAALAAAQALGPFGGDTGAIRVLQTGTD